MSDQSEGPGWWQASDGKWYSPETHPDYRPPPPPPSNAPPPPQPATPAPPAEVIELKGVNGTIIFDGNMVIIRRSGAMARMTVGKGEKRIPVRSVTAVQFKPAGMAVRGYIQFTIPGGNERRSAPGRQTTDAAKDENSVLFAKGDQAAFENLRDAIEARLT